MSIDYHIYSSFNVFIKNCIGQETSGLKIISFPTGMGKTYGSSGSAIEVVKSGNLPIFIAPRIAILKDFEDTVIKQLKDIEIIRIISDTELKQVDYYYTNFNSFKKIAESVEEELLNFIKINKVSLPLSMIELDIYFSTKNEYEIKLNKEYYFIYKIYKASKNIKDIFRQFNLLKNNLYQEEIRKDLNSKLWKVYSGIIDIFEVSHYFYFKNNNKIFMNLDDKNIYKIWQFNSFDKKIIKDFFGLTIALFDIKNNKKNHKYVFTLTSKKSLKYINRVFEFKNNKIIKISGNDNNKLFFSGYINNFCKNNEILSVYYIDEADEFYNEIIEDKTKTIHLNNFLFKIKTFFDYSNISSLLSFINKLEKNKITSYLSDDFKEFIFNYENVFTAEIIEDYINFFEANKIYFDPTQNISEEMCKKINEKIKCRYEIFKLFQNENIINKENVLFLFLCFLDSLGIIDKIEQLDKNEKIKNTLFLKDLCKSIKYSRDFFNLWYLDKNSNFNMNHNVLFKELNKVNALFVNSSLGETIIKNEDFIDLAENNKFMFGNDNLSLIEEQIKYLNNLSSVENFSDNALLELNKNNIELTLSYIFSFLAKVVIRTIQEFNIPNEDYSEDRTLDKEISCQAYMKKMKTAFSNLNKINDSQFKIKNEDLLFDQDYIFNQDKNVINLFTTNYDKNIKFGKPNMSSYIQMSNIHIKESPEKEILNYFSTVESNEIKDFSFHSIVFLMSATSTINSYYGNFDYEYLKKQFLLNNVLFDATYLNNNDIELVNSYKNPYINKELTKISCHDYSIYENNKFPLYDNFYHFIKISEDKSIEILTGEYNKYKLYEFQSFIYCIENLIINKDINSLFFISQTTSHIVAFIKLYLNNILNSNSKLIYKYNNKGIDYENIFVIDKTVFNNEYSKYNYILDKDLIIIFYDSKFENKQKMTMKYLETNDFEDEDVSDIDLDNLDKQYNFLKREIFNEDKYNVLLCSSFGSISKGFNFVTNKKNEEKDFDAINIGMDPFYDNLSQEKDESLVYQRIIAMKDFNYQNGKSCNLNELINYFYLNKNYLLEKEHVASIARIIIQSLGRIERRRHKNINKTQYLFINNETYKKMEKFYHFYEYERYIFGTNEDKKNNFSSNLSVNNQYLFNMIETNTDYLPDCSKYIEEQVNKNKILEEIVSFLLLTIRKKEIVKSDFKNIWEKLKSPIIFHDLSEYIKNLDEFVEPILFKLVNKYAKKRQYPNLVDFVENKKNKLSDIFFVKFSSDVRIGLSTIKINDKKQYDIIVDYNNAKKSECIFFNFIFNIDKEEFSSDALKYIKWLDQNITTEELFRKKYTINNTLYVPQKKVAIEFIKTALSEEIFKNILNSYKFKFQYDIDKKSYELFDFFIKHNNKNKYTAIDIKFWSISTQAISSKNIEEKVNRKYYVTDLSNIQNILCVNLFGKTKNVNFKNNIYYENLFVKDYVRNSPNYGKFVLNTKIINFLKEEIQK